MTSRNVGFFSQANENIDFVSFSCVCQILVFSVGSLTNRAFVSTTSTRVSSFHYLLFDGLIYENFDLKLLE